MTADRTELQAALAYLREGRELQHRSVAGGALLPQLARA